MKIKYYFLALILLASCSDKRQYLIDQIKEKEAIVSKSYEDIPDKSTSESLRNDYLEFAQKFPDDTLSPVFLHKAAELALAIDMPKEAVSAIDTLQKHYSDYKFLPDAIFFKGFVLENYLKDLPAAQKTYNDFILKWPNHDLVPQVKAAIENMGKSPEDIVKEFMERTQQTDSLSNSL